MTRFVAFSFSTADILIETDLEGVIGFHAGATSRFEGLATVTSGSTLADCFGPAGRSIIATVLNAPPNQGRAGPFPIQSGDARGELSAWRMKDAPSIQWAIRLKKDKQGAAASGGEFAEAAGRAIEKARAAGRSVDLALVWLDNAEEVRDVLSDREADGFFESLQQLARLHAFEDVRTEISETVVGLLPAEPGALKQLEADIDALARAEGFERVSAASRSLKTEGLEPEQAVEVFLEAAAGFDPDDIDPAFDDPYAAVAERARRLSEARKLAVKLSIHNRIFEPYVQPLVDPKAGAPAQYEMLCRLPGGRSFAPGLLLAEQSEATIDLDLAMCEAAIEFLEASPDRPGLHVNLSPRSLGAPGFFDMLNAKLRATKIAPERLVFEITETAEIQNFELVRSITDRLRSMGYRIAIDDFGSGAAGMAYLFKLPVDMIKLDGGLVPQSNPTEWEREMFREMARFAHGLGSQVVAERVEHRWQALVFEQAGFDLLQGFLYGKPFPLAELGERFKPRAVRQGAIEAFG
ncbi:MAG: EAL domain-containing protein [Oceanicaulis sp.]